VKIIHRATNEMIAEGERGWAICAFHLIVRVDYAGFFLTFHLTSADD
jgi:hypothetical protein